MQTGWQLESSRRQIVCSNFLQCVCRGGSQLPVTAAKKWQGCLFKQQCELEIKLGQRRCFVDFLAKLSFNMQLLEYRFRWSNSSSHFSCSYLPLICLSTNQIIQLMHSLLIRTEWTTGNGILVSSSHWPIYNKLNPDYDFFEYCEHRCHDWRTLTHNHAALWSYQHQHPPAPPRPAPVMSR